MITLSDIQRHVGVQADGIVGPATVAAIAKALGIEAPKRKLADAATFFAQVRKTTGGLTQVQVDTINDILTSAAHWPIGHVAYGLATAWHEARFLPQDEIGKGAGHSYSARGKYGQSQYGRGLVQLTWDRNYEWADKALSDAGIITAGDLLKDFSLALRPDIAAFILVKGMETGAFTGKSLSDYINGRGTLSTFIPSRRIINVLDKAELIAGYAVSFQNALDAGGWA